MNHRNFFVERVFSIYTSHALNTFYSVELYAIVDNICAIDSKAISIFVIALFRAPQAVSFNTMSM